MTGAELERRRVALGFARQQDFADYIDVNLRTVQRWIADDVAIPRTVELLVTLLGMVSPNRWPR